MLHDFLTTYNELRTTDNTPRTPCSTELVELVGIMLKIERTVCEYLQL